MVENACYFFVSLKTQVGNGNHENALSGSRDGLVQFCLS